MEKPNISVEKFEQNYNIFCDGDLSSMIISFRKKIMPNSAEYIHKSNRCVIRLNLKDGSISSAICQASGDGTEHSGFAIILFFSAVVAAITGEDKNQTQKVICKKSGKINSYKISVTVNEKTGAMLAIS